MEVSAENTEILFCDAAKTLYDDYLKKKRFEDG